MSDVTTTEKSSQAVKKCFEWLKWCLDNGWPRTALDDLEKLWWQYHDEHGELIT
jgi:hypothetical protein